ncbi:hypothetical protein [Fischerella sp. PCC 9605]|uniref:hypothetical protein n=1 Tax=Fischerella sp. PCC 9605 TaxID=1173024 RepID=UPI00047E05AF|nr:hypothetical protein [Fischerella sp. PCC 9605]
MRENTKKIGVLQQIGKTLYEFAEFIISPWLYGGSVHPLKRRVELLERRVYQGLQDKEESQDRVIQDLQQQIDCLQESSNSQLEKIINYELRQQVLGVLKEQTNIVNKIIKPAVEDVMRELEHKKQLSETTTNTAEIQKRQDRLRQSLANIEKLTTSLPYLEAQRAACIEAGRWLLARRVEVAQRVTNELLSPQHSQTEELRQNICKYLKLLGSCMENEIEPRLLYKRVITHQQPPVQTYVKAFQLIKSKYISDWEFSHQISSKAAEELRGYFSYLIYYLLTALV